VANDDVLFSGAVAWEEQKRLQPELARVPPREARDRPLRATGMVPGEFSMWAVENEWYLACLLGANPPTPIRGYGGWGQRERQGRRSVTVFEGTETPAFSIDLVLENVRVPMAGGTRAKWRDLERLCGWDLANDNPPPVVQWQANAPHHDYNHAMHSEWVCESLEWTAQVYTDRATLIRAEATIVLALFRSTEVDVSPARSFPRKQLKVGWDLRDFARKYLGNASRWKDVAELNRDNPKCPQSPSFKPSRPVMLMVPPKEPKAKAKKKKRR
jgi:hypothetical protein